MKKGKITAALLAAVLTISMAGCGNDVSEKDSSRAAKDTSAVDQSSSDSSETSTTGTEKETDSSESQAQSTTTATTGADSSESSETTASASDSSSQTDTKQTEATQTQKTTTKSQTAPQTTTTTAATKATTPAGGGNETFTVPTSGQWIGGVVVCDRNLGPKIRGLINFSGDESCGRYFTSMVNDMKKMVGNSINVYTMGAPVSSAYYTPKGMTGVTSDQHKAITDLNKTLRSDVKNVDTYAVLAPHVSEYIYYRTDHHWTELAAYYAAEAFAKTAGVPFKTLSEMQAGVKKGFTGSMHYYSNCQEFLTYPDTYYYWKPKNSYTTTYYNGYFQGARAGSLFYDWATGSNCYLSVLGTDDTIAEIKTDVKNGRTLVLFKDSYGNALVPYFVGSFEKIYVLDMRYTHVGLKNFYKQVGATDILFGSSLSSFYTPSRADSIRALMY